ncbi:MAG: hypothetical protein ACTS1X_10140 [Parasphingopyxis sp.]|uniref:hypothetical protein n=1 Tax=Parasphingopyxis sp. TaxID=1920299 RepID=UPI003F9F17A2
MAAFRALLALLCLGIAGYTAIVVGAHGMNLFPAFFGDIAALGWPGQFNVDFLSFLILSAFWVAWRHAFSAAGLGLALLAFFGGGLFLTVYLLIASFSANGDVRILLLGPGRAAS